MPDIDNLSIKIKSDVSNANRSIDSLISKINVLSNSMKSFDSKGLQKFSSGMNMLVSSMQKMKDVNLSVFTKSAKGLQKFESIDGQKLASVSNAIAPLAMGISQLSKVSFDGKNLSSFLNSVSTLANSNIQNINSSNLVMLGNNITALTRSLANAKAVQSNTIQIVNAVARLANAGDKAGATSAALPLFAQNLRALINTMSKAPTVADGTTQFANAIGLLANAGAKAKATASGLGVLSIELKKFFQVMATAPNVSGNVISMTNALGNLANHSRGLGNATRGLSSGLTSFGSSAKGATKNSFSLASAIGKVYATYWLLFRAMGLVKKSMDISSDLTEVQNVVDNVFGDMRYKVEEMADVSIQKFGMSELALKQYSSRFQAMGTAMGITSQQVGQANDYLASHTDGYVAQSDALADVSLGLTKLTADLASFYNMDQSSVAEDLESVFTGQTRPLRTYGLDLTEATLKEWAMNQGLQANIDTMTQAEKTMLRYQYVMQNTAAAHNDFSRTSDTWANQMRILREQLVQLGGVMGTAFINMLKPLVSALNKAMGAVITFAETVVNALGVIFGWKLEVTNANISEDFQEAAAGASDLAGGTGKAAENAKKLKQQLQGFHELNVLTSPNDGSGGGGGGGGAGGGAGGNGSSGGAKFQVTETEGLFESQLDTLYKLGDYIGSTLTSTLNSIKWDEVYEGARNFGKGLADFLNGLISPELFGALARTIAGSLNTVLYSLNSFGHTFDWNDFGYSIATGINEYFKTYNFSLMADTINTIAMGILDALNVAVASVDWSLVGKSIGEFINDIDVADLMINFAGLALNIIKALGDAIMSLSKENPLAGAIVSILLGIKFTNKLNAIGSSILTAIGFGIKADTGNPIVSAIKTKLESSALGEAITAFGSSVGFQIFKGVTAGLATWFAGWSVGNWLRENTDAGEYIDQFAGSVIQSETHTSGETTRKDVSRQIYNQYSGQKGISELDLQNYMTEIGDAYDLAISKGYKASEAIAYAHIAALDSYEAMIQNEEKVAYEYELYGATYEKVRNSMVASNKKSTSTITKNTMKEVLAYKAGKTSIESLSSSAKSNLSNVSQYVKEYLDFREGKKSFDGLSSGAKSAFSTIDAYVNQNKITTQELARQYGISYSNMQTTVSTVMNNNKNIINNVGNETVSIASRSSVSTKNAYVNGLNGMPTEVQQKLSQVVPTVTSGLSTEQIAGTKGANTKSAYLSGFNGMPSDVANRMSQTVNTVSSSMDNVVNTASSKSSSIHSAVLNGFNGMPSDVANRMNAVTNAISASNWKDIGKNLTAGLGNGIANSWVGNVWDKVKGFAQTLTTNLKRVFGVRSPSRVWRDEIGKYLPEGLAIGIDSSADTAVKSVENLGASLNKAMKENLDDELFQGKEIKAVRGIDVNYEMTSSFARGNMASINNSIDNVNAVIDEYKLSNSIASAVATAINTQDNSQPIVINLDGREVFNSTRRYANDYYNQTGRPAFNF